MRKRYTKYRKPRRPPLDEDLILTWADEHFEQFGVWPRLASGPVTGHDGEHWGYIDKALRHGYRGLLLGSSLAILLSERRGVPNRRGRPAITVEDILLWADHHFAIYGRYPNIKDGTIDLAPAENWCALNMAIRVGSRGLPGGSTLARLLQAHRGKRNQARLPKISQATILEWADEHYERTGKWPIATSGEVQAAPGEVWNAIDQALKQGLRGLPGGKSLAALLIQHRGKRDIYPLSIEMITDWLRSHASRHGKYPALCSGIVEDAPDENWWAVDRALFKGYRGLPGGSTLASLKQRLIQEGKLPSLGERADYSVEDISAWMSAYCIRHGSYPTVLSGIIDEAPEENWNNVNSALSKGRRGLPGGSSLAQLRQELISEGKLPDLNTRNYAFPAHGESGLILIRASYNAAPTESCNNEQRALLYGLRGLSGGFSGSFPDGIP